MILIAKKQRVARQSAKNLIDFENIVVDTDFGGAVSFRAMHDGRASLSGDPDDIIDELASEIKEATNEDADHVKKDSLVRQRKLGGQKRLGKSGSTGDNQKNIEMSNLNKMNHFVIDDDEDDDDSQAPDSARENS